MVKQSLVTGTIDALFDAALSSSSTSVVGKRLADGGAIGLAGREGLVSPAFPEELVKWLESNNISSQKLNPQRPGDKAEIKADKQARREPSRVEKKETKNPEVESSGQNVQLRCVTEDKRESNGERLKEKL